MQTQKVCVGARWDAPLTRTVTWRCCLFSCRGKVSFITAQKQTGRACSVSRVCAVAGGRADPASCGRKRTCEKEANKSRARPSLTPPWTRDLTFRLLPITSAWHLAHIPPRAHAPALCEGGAGQQWSLLRAVHGWVKEWKAPCLQGVYTERDARGDVTGGEEGFSLQKTHAQDTE